MAKSIVIILDIGRVQILIARDTGKTVAADPTALGRYRPLWNPQCAR